MRVKRPTVCLLLMFILIILTAGCFSKSSSETVHPPKLEKKTAPSLNNKEREEAVRLKKVSDQHKAADQYAKKLDGKIAMNSEASYDIHLPDTFTETINDVPVGELMQRANEESSQNGMDFSGYLGKPVTLYTFALEKEGQIFVDVDLILDGDKVVGYWIDEDRNPPDFNVIVNAIQNKSYK